MSIIIYLIWQRPPFRNPVSLVLNLINSQAAPLRGDRWLIGWSKF